MERGKEKGKGDEEGRMVREKRDGEGEGRSG